jgi:hypothetical protein
MMHLKYLVYLQRSDVYHFTGLLCSLTGIPQVDIFSNNQRAKLVFKVLLKEQREWSYITTMSDNVSCHRHPPPPPPHHHHLWGKNNQNEDDYGQVQKLR